LNKAIAQRFPNAMLQFAWGTFVINVSGSFLIGFLMTLLMERLRVSSYWHLVLVVGFLGGYTTFSSFEYDGYLTARSGSPMTTVLYLAGSVIFGYAAVWLGVLLATRR
jgi:CrcB protein